jgi:DNA-binding SARP family transcriptional activator
MAIKFLRLFGGVQLERDGAVLPLSSERAHQALVYLAQRADWCHREQLGGLFWPHLDDESARRNVRKALHNLRRLGLAEELHSSGDLVRVLLPTDVEQFRALMQAHEYVQAISWVRGPFAAHMGDGRTPRFDQWLQGERVRLATQWRTAAHLALPALEPAGAAELARALLADDAFDEIALRALVRALAQLGALAEARRVAGAFAAMLLRELGSDLSATSRALLAELGIEPAPLTRDR